jgi:WG containing repeat
MIKILPYLIFLLLFLYTPFSTKAVVENRYVATIEATDAPWASDSIITPKPTNEWLPKKQEVPFYTFDNGFLGMILAPLLALILLTIYGKTIGGSELFFLGIFLLVFFVALALSPLFFVRLIIRYDQSRKKRTNKERETLSQKAYRSFSTLYTILGTVGLFLGKWLAGAITFLLFIAIAQLGVYLTKNIGVPKDRIKTVALKPVGSEGKYGYQNKEGILTIPYQYQMTNVFQEGLAHVKLNDKWGYIDARNNKVIDFVYDDAKAFSHGLAAVRQNGKYGYINTSGKTVIPFEYDDANSFIKEKAEVWKNGRLDTLLFPKAVSIAPKPSEVITEKLPFLRTTKTALKPVGNAGKYGYCSANGYLVIPYQYQMTNVFQEDLAHVKLNNKWGYIDNNNTKIIDFVYDDAKAFSQGLAVVRQNGKYGYINTTGKTIIPFEYDDANSFINGKAEVWKNGRLDTLLLFQAIATKEKSVTPSEIKAPAAPEKELFLVERAGKYGFKDLDGNTPITPRYTIAYDFKEGFAQVQLDNKWGFINKKGETIGKIQYDDCNAFSEGLAVVQQNGNYGYINRQGKIVIAPQFSRATDFKNGKATVEKEGSSFWIDQAGRKL